MNKSLRSVLIPAVLLLLGYTALGQTGPKLDKDLLDAADLGDVTKVQQLLDQGANIEAKNSKGMTPLILATMKDHVAVVELLLEKGTLHPEDSRYRRSKV